MKHFRSVVSLLMVFVLCFGMIPCAFADEITTPTAPQSGEGSASEAVPPNTDQTPPPEESAAPPEESTEPPSEEATEPMEEDPTDETTLPEELDDLDSDDRLLGAEAYASTQKSIMLFDFADNGDYTTRLNYQVSCAYKPNGSGTTRTAYVKNMGWHFARYGGVAHADEPLYCIEPWRNYAVFTATRYLPSASNSSYNIWYMSGSSYQTTISLYNAGSNGLNAYFKIKAPSLGNISLTKTTEDGTNLSGWKFGIYSDSACTKLVSGPYTTNSSGKLSVTGLNAGTYYVKELGNTDSSIDALYSCASTNPQRVTIASGQTASVSFYNKRNTGSVQLVKKTNTGENLGGWKIGLYTDAACTNSVSGSPFTTGADGTVTVSGLQKGTYYAKEISTDDPYWEFDTAVKSVTVAISKTAEVTFTDTHYGRIEIRKTTNTGNQLGGWTFRVRDSNGNSYGDFTTDENGYACTQNLPLGWYTVAELPTEDNYWLTELGFHDVTVKAGETTVDTWLNKEQGLVWFYKKTNTGQSVEGWHITVYSDEACTQKVGTLITNADGKAGYYLDPGTYWAKETGDEHGRFEDEYWMVDETIHKFEIQPHEDVSITFTNVQYGRLKISKTMEGGGSVEGWQFKITDAEGKVLDGSPFASNKDGIILTGNLLPGQYTVEELLPENSLYQCISENPQTVTVKQGEIAEASFVNALRTGKVTVEKIDISGAHLAGATFRLEWSEDGYLWHPVTYSETIVRGGCSNPDVTDGSLTTGTDGLLEWDNLYPGLQYRLTETKAPEGYKLLDKAAYEGALPADDLALSVRVTNTRTFTMPDTGGNTAMIFRILSMISGTVCLAMLIYSKKRLV